MASKVRTVSTTQGGATSRAAGTNLEAVLRKKTALEAVQKAIAANTVGQKKPSIAAVDTIVNAVTA